MARSAIPGSSAARGLPGEKRLHESRLVAKEALEVAIFRHGARPRRRRTSDFGAGGRGVVGSRAPLATGSRGCRGAWFLNLVIAWLGELVDGVEDRARIRQIAHIADAPVSRAGALAALVSHHHPRAKNRSQGFLRGRKRPIRQYSPTQRALLHVGNQSYGNRGFLERSGALMHTALEWHGAARLYSVIAKLFSCVMLPPLAGAV